MPASRRSVSRAPRPHGLTPAAASAFQSVGARAAGHDDLEAVLAGVAGARDEDVAERSRRALNGFSAAVAASLPGSACQTFARALRTLHGDHREVGARRRA